MFFFFSPKLLYVVPKRKGEEYCFLCCGCSLLYNFCLRKKRRYLTTSFSSLH